MLLALVGGMAYWLFGSRSADSSGNDKVAQNELSATMSDSMETESTAASTAQAATAPSTDGPQAVDLGLSVRWADRNVGASSPTDYGGHYGWGDASGTKTSKRVADYPSEMPPSQISGDASYDIAAARSGGQWRLPTKAEVDELRQRCSWSSTTRDGVWGYDVTGPSGESIFLPAAGCRLQTQKQKVNKFGYYWTGDLGAKRSDCAYGFYFYGSTVGCDEGNRYYGFSVRPVLTR